MYIAELIKSNTDYKKQISFVKMQKEIFEKMKKESWVSIELVNDTTADFCFLKERYDGIYQLNIQGLFLSNSKINLKIDSLANSEDYLAWIKRLKDSYCFSKKLYIYDGFKSTFELDLLLGENVNFENLTIFTDQKISLEIKGKLLSLADFQTWWVNNLNNVHLDNETKVFHKFIISSKEKDKVVITALDAFWHYKKHNQIVFEKWDHLWQTSNGLFLQKQNGKCFLLLESSILLEVPWKFENIKEVDGSNILLTIYSNKGKHNFRILRDVVEPFKTLIYPEEECLNLIIGTSINITPNCKFFKYNIENYDLTLLGRYIEHLWKLNPTHKVIILEDKLKYFLQKLDRFHSSFWEIKCWFMSIRKENKWQMMNWYFIPLFEKDWLQWLMQFIIDKCGIYHNNLITIDAEGKMEKRIQLGKSSDILAFPQYCLLKERKFIILQSIDLLNKIKWKNLIITNNEIKELQSLEKTILCLNIHWKHFLIWRNKNKTRAFIFKEDDLAWKPIMKDMRYLFETLLNGNIYHCLSENRQLLFKHQQKFEVSFWKDETPTLTFLESWKKITLKKSPHIYKNNPYIYWLALPNCILVLDKDCDDYSSFMVNVEKDKKMLNAKWKHFIKF